LRPVRAVSIFVCLLTAAVPSASLDLSAERVAFRHWFTFLAESRYYARKQLREVSDGDSLIRWACREAVKEHDASWSHSIELPVLPAMPSVDPTGFNANSNPFAAVLVSKDLNDAEPGDLLIYKRSALAEHSMIYIGRSQVVPSPTAWVVYLTDSPKKVHRVSLQSLLTDPTPEWRPVPENPEFSGVWRLRILR